MITREKVKEYIWAGGDIDGYARSGRRSDIADADWFLIDRTVSAIGMIRRGQAAQSFKQRHEEQVREDFDSRETYELLVDYEAKSEPDAAPNGGPATRLRNSAPGGGPPSVS